MVFSELLLVLLGWVEHYSVPGVLGHCCFEHVHLTHETTKTMKARKALSLTSKSDNVARYKPLNLQSLYTLGENPMKAVFWMCP